MVFDISFVFSALEGALKALPVTLILTFFPLLIGMIFGIPMAVARKYKVRFLAGFLKGVTTVIKGIPSILLVLIVNYLILKPIDYLAQFYDWAKPLQTMDKIYIGIVALSVYTIIQLTETFRSALLTVNEGQYEACYSVGMTKWQTLTSVVFPQAFPAALPMLCNNFIEILKTTSIVYLISVNDILNAAKNSAATNFRYLEAYIAAALIYWAMCVLIERVFYLLEKKYKIAGGVK